MKTIWKFQIPKIEDEIFIDMPKGAAILTVQVQGGSVCLWAKVDSDSLMVKRRFRIYGTGHPVDEPNLRYIGTFQIFAGELVFHLFEDPERIV